LALRLLAVITALERSLARLPLLTLELLALRLSLLSDILASLSAASAEALVDEALALSRVKTRLQLIPALAKTLALLPGARLALASLSRRGEAPIHELFFDD